MTLARAARVLRAGALLAIGCGTDPVPATSPDAARDAPLDVGATEAGSDGAPAPDAALDAGAPSFELVTDQHRYDPGKMFGGWGPHLGHLLRRPNGDAWFVDDVCTQTPNQPDTCDVLHNRALGYFRRDPSGWKEIARQALPGDVQQNTGTVLLGNGTTLATFGIDVAGHHVVECTFDVVTSAKSCSSLPFVLGAAANYVGAAIAPSKAVVVWWTEVKDGGGGTFHWIVDYGGGWNGPRSGLAAGYNDSSYAHVTFGAGGVATAMTWHVQLVSGLAPNWSFLGAVGTSSLATTDAVTFQNALAPPNGDAVVSTNDVLTDPTTGDVHLFARTNAGLASYHHLPSAGAWSGALFTVPAYRARLLLAGDALVLVYGKPGALGLRVARPKDRKPKTPIAWASLAETSVALPKGFGDVYAIYPVAPMYQVGTTDRIEVAVVGSGVENRVYGVSLNP
jgi:hypothetical protein